MAKKQKLDEGMIMMSPLLPVGGVHGLGGFKNKEDNFEFKGFPGQFDEDGKKIMDEQGQPIKEATDFIAFYGGKQYPIKGNDLWDAKQKAIKQLKIPKSKQGLLAVKSKKSMDKGDFMFDGKINEAEGAAYYKNMLADVEDMLSELVNIGVDGSVFQDPKSANKMLKQAYKLVNKVR